MDAGAVDNDLVDYRIVVSSLQFTALSLTQHRICILLHNFPERSACFINVLFIIAVLYFAIFPSTMYCFGVNLPSLMVDCEAAVNLGDLYYYYYFG